MPTPDIDDETIRWTIDVRRRLHRSPDLTGEEGGTQRMVFSMLDELGITARPISDHGILAEIRGFHHGRTIALRADMDALCITEVPTERNVDYISSKDGIMHACGHDGHMAMVLGAARALNKMRDSLHGTVRLLFQPHEEAYPGGAPQMIDEGALEGVDAILGFHIMGYLPAGEVAFRAGDLMAHITSWTFALSLIHQFPHEPSERGSLLRCQVPRVPQDSPNDELQEVVEHLVLQGPPTVSERYSPVLAGTYPRARMTPLLLEQGKHQQNEVPVSPGPLHVLHLTPAEAEMLLGVPIGLLDFPSTDVTAEDSPGLPAPMAGRMILRIVREVRLLPGDDDLNGAGAPEPGLQFMGPVRGPGNHDRLDIAKVQ